jgi:ADP-heptose:LPS heptosyltransferase
VLGDDAALAREVAAAADAEARAGLDVPGWKAAIASAAALITPDSGAAHVAGMLGVPCVDCFPPGRAREMARWSPWAAPFRTIALDPARSPAQLGTRLAREAAELLQPARPGSHA